LKIQTALFLYPSYFRKLISHNAGLEEKAFILNESKRGYEEKAMDLVTSKNLGGVGALLIFIGPLLGFVPRVGLYTGLLSLVGLILVLIGLKGFADHYREQGIFNNALYAVIATIVGGVAVAAVVIFAFVDLFTELGLTLTNIQDWSSMTGVFSDTSNLNTLLRFAGIVFLAIVILFVLLVIAAFFLRKSLTLMATKTGVGLFGTTGLLLLIGAVLIIIFGLGVILMWIATLLLAIAFFSIRVQTEPQMAPTSSSPPQAPV
jgi:uncharacterized membrane protein